MKKLLATILALVYFTTSSGVMVNLHYCMGKLKSWDLAAVNKGKCGTCGMEKSGPKGCCHDEYKQLKVESDQKISESTIVFLSLSHEATTAGYSELPLIYSSSLIADNPTSHAPPLTGGVLIFLANRNFRI